MAQLPHILWQVDFHAEKYKQNTEETKGFANDWQSHIKQLNTLGSYYKRSQQPLLVYSSTMPSHGNAWVDGLKNKVQLYPLTRISYIHEDVDWLINGYIEKIVEVMYNISQYRQLILVTEGDMNTAYNYTCLKIRNRIKEKPNPVAPFVWVIDLKSCVLCIRTPIDQNELAELLETKCGEKLSHDHREVMQRVPRVEAKAEVFIASSESVNSYAWVLGSYETIPVLDLSISVKQAQENREFVDELQKKYNQMLYSDKEKTVQVIKNCAQAHGFNYVYNMLYYPWVGPTNYWAVTQSNFKIHEVDPRERLNQDYQILQTPYNKSTWTPTYSRPDMSDDRLVCFLPWNDMGYIIFSHMASDIQTWLINRRYLEPKSQDYSIYMKRLKVYARSYMPDTRVKKVDSVEYLFDYSLDLYKISFGNTGNVLPYDSCNVWLPDNHLLVLRKHSNENIILGLQSNSKAMEDKIHYILRKRKLNTLTSGVLKVAAYVQFYPVCYLDKNNEIKGFDVDLINEFAKIVGCRVEFTVINEWDQLWFAPSKKEADISIGGIGITDDRIDSNTEWTIPYFYVRRSVVYNINKPVKRFPDDMTGTIRGTYGSTGYNDGILRIKKFKPDSHLSMTAGDSDDKDIKDVLEGRIQGIMRGSFVCKSIVARYGSDKLGYTEPWDIDPTLVTSDGECFAYPCHKQSGLAVILSSFLTQMWLTGYLERKAKEYDMDG